MGKGRLRFRIGTINFRGKTRYGIGATDFLVSVGVVAIFFGLLAFATYFVFARTLSSKEAIMNNNNTGLVLLDRNGKPFFRFYQAHYSEFIPISEIPLEMQDAVISAEDKQFYDHQC
jgi:membrane peptidoglycan carboxypeptidase